MYSADGRRTLAPQPRPVITAPGLGSYQNGLFNVPGCWGAGLSPAWGALQGPPLQPVIVLCDARGMTAAIREYKPSDENVVVEFALRAWAPVFASIDRVLGADLSARLHGGEDGWRGYQETAVRRALTDASMNTWVAEVEATVVGFVSAHLTGDRQIGEIFMLAVDPEQQGEGIGTTLTEVATDWLRASGALVALVETGGDPGHAPARRVYEKAAYTMLPIARYFRLL